MKLLTGTLIVSTALAIGACTPQQQNNAQKQADQAVRSIPSPVKKGVEDAALTAQVAGAIAAQAGVNVFHVTPSVHGGVVTLTGKVPTMEIKSTIIGSVRRVHGVEVIVDRIEIAKP